MTRLAWLLSEGSFEARVEQARLAEEVGFAAVVLRPISGREHDLPPWIDDAASGTSRLELIAIATPVFDDHPVSLARRAAELSDASGGRLVLGLGTGDAEAVDPGEGRVVPNWERMGRLQEAIPIVRALLRGEVVDHGRPYHRVVGDRLTHPPAHPVRVWMLADGPSSAGMAARLAEGLVVEVADPGATLAEIVEPFRAAAPAGAPVLALVRADPGAELDAVMPVVEALRPDRVAVGVSTRDPLAAMRSAAAALLPQLG